MPVGAVTLAVGAYAASEQKKGAKKAANAIQSGADGATAEKARQFDITQQNIEPWLQTGRTANDYINRLLGGDTSGFMTSPDYVVARDEGLKGLDRSLAARGALGSGGADADRITFASNLGTQALGNYRNWLQGISQGGYSAATTLGNFGQNKANAVGDNMLMGANARASAYGQRGDTNAQLAGVIGGGFNNWLQGRGGGMQAFGLGNRSLGYGAGMGDGSLANFGNNTGNFMTGWGA